MKILKKIGLYILIFFVLFVIINIIFDEDIAGPICSVLFFGYFIIKVIIKYFDNIRIMVQEKKIPESLFIYTFASIALVSGMKQDVNQSLTNLTAAEETEKNTKGNIIVGLISYTLYTIAVIAALTFLLLVFANIGEMAYNFLLTTAFLSAVAGLLIQMLVTLVNIFKNMNAKERIIKIIIIILCIIIPALIVFSDIKNNM